MKVAYRSASNGCGKGRKKGHMVMAHGIRPKAKKSLVVVWVTPAMTRAMMLVAGHGVGYGGLFCVGLCGRGQACVDLVTQPEVHEEPILCPSLW